MNNPEHLLQSALIKWWALQHKLYGLPELALLAIPNGGLRNKITASRLKREGVRRGVSDLFLCAPNKEYHGLWIEMKAGNNGTSNEQKQFIAHADANGYKTAVCWDWEVAASVIHDYLKG